MQLVRYEVTPQTRGLEDMARPDQLHASLDQSTSYALDVAFATWQFVRASALPALPTREPRGSRAEPPLPRRRRRRVSKMLALRARPM